MKKDSNIMPKSTFVITGDVADFTRLDNLYKSLKREGEKLLKNWNIEVKVEYTEKEGEIEEV